MKKKILEDLIFLGRVEKTYSVFGKEWVLATLTSNEQLDATSSTSNFDTLARLNAIKIAILARSIKKVDGVELNDVDENLELIGKFQIPLINALFEKFEELQKEQESSLKDLSELKN